MKLLDSTDFNPKSREVLSRISELDWVTDFYLAGSAALALYLRHRPIRDLDLMSQVCRLRAIERRDLLQDLLAWDPSTKVVTARDGFLYVRVKQEIGLRFFYYPYPLVTPEASIDKLSIASPEDLGLMKLGAIISRGTRRDFVDLYLLCQEIELSQLLEKAQDKFGHVDDFMLQALKGLADLSLTEGEPMPILTAPLEWKTVRKWLDNQVRSLGREHVGLK